MRIAPAFQDFIKGKLPERSYQSHDWRESNVEYIIAHILYKSGVTEMKFCEQGLYKKLHFGSLTVNNYIPVIYQNGKYKEYLPLFWALLRNCNLRYCGGAGNESKPYAQACLVDDKIEREYGRGYMPNIKFGDRGGVYVINAGTSKEFFKNIYCYFHQLKYDEKT